MDELAITRCANPQGCDTVLDIPAKRPRLSVASFPEDTPSVALALAQDPAVHACPACEYENWVMDGCCIRSSEVASVLFVDRDSQDAFLAETSLADLASRVGSATAFATTERRAFKRAFLEASIAKRLTLLNKMVVRAQQEGTSFPVQVSDHLDQLDRAFFAAHFLVALGVVPLARQPTSEATVQGSAFVPGANFGNNDEAVRSLQGQIGELAFVFAWSALIDGMQKRDVIDAGAERILMAIPPVFLGPDGIEAAFLQTLNSARELFSLNGEGAITARYTIEAAAALVYLAARTPYPDQKVFSHFLAFFEAHRTLDASSEAQLLDPKVLRAMTDRQTFVAAMRGFGRDWAGKDVAPEEAARITDALDTAVQRIYPDEPTLQEPGFVVRGVDPDNIRHIICRIFGLARERGFNTWSAATQSLNFARGTGNQSCIDAAVEEIRALAEGMEPVDRVGASNGLTEFLNGNGRLAIALEIVEETYCACENLLTDDDARAFPGVSAFYTELGNCLRYAGRFPQSLAAYERALHLEGDAISDTNRCNLERNVAIVLRSMGQTSEARAILTDLKARASSYQLCGIVFSHALCLIAEGRSDDACRYIIENENVISGRSLYERDVRGLTSALAESYMLTGNCDSALLLYHQVMQVSDAIGDSRVAATARARHIWLRHARGDEIPALEIDEMLDALDALVRTDDGMEGITVQRVGSIRVLVDMLVALERFEEAERAIAAMPSDLCIAWQIKLTGALLMARRNVAGPELAEAVAKVIAGLDEVARETDPSGDPFALFSGDEGKIIDLAQLVVAGHRKGVFNAALVRIVADLQASPVLSRRIVADRPDEAPALVAADDEAVSELLRTHNGGLVQGLVVGRGGALGLVLTWIEDGAARTETVALGLGRAEADKLTRILAARIDEALSDAPELPLDAVPGWAELSGAILGAVSARLAEGSYLLVVPGALDARVLTLALGERHPLVFGASLAAAIGLDRRRSGAGWAPRAVADFAVWRARDRADMVEAIKVGAEALVALAEAGSPPAVGTAVTGRDGDAAQLLRLLGETDLLRISTHGTVAEGTNEVHLILAAKGALPPSTIRGVGKRHHDAHRMSWTALSTLDRAPGVVVSTACNSGLVATPSGGERLGLERALFRAGSFCFVAPLWEMPIKAAQRLSLSLIEAVLAEPETPVARHLWAVRRAAARDGVSPIAYAGMAAFGSMS